ncbi:MAG: hypothetical protein CM1200mP22_07270 [Dehalococcoidia bacterium]|nr:MAG: hypothetical protein CM1200mP22_07270 [Dehalococcoidia bacterium]
MVRSNCKHGGRLPKDSELADFDRRFYFVGLNGIDTDVGWTVLGNPV